MTSSLNHIISEIQRKENVIGSDADDFNKAIEVICNERKYFSKGIITIVEEYFSNKEMF